MSLSYNTDVNAFKGVFLDTYNSPISGAWYKVVANDVVSTNGSLVGVYPGVDGVAGLAAYSGTRQLQATTDFKVTIQNQEFEDSLKIPLAQLRGDALGLYAGKVQEMAKKAQFHFNTLTSTLLTGGTGTNCQDGTPFFGTTHPYGASSTQKNLLVAADVPSLNVVDPANPTPTEMASIIVDITSYMHTLRDRAGDQINGDMRKIAILTGDFQKFSAIVSAITQVVLPGGVSNPVTGIKGYGYEFIPVLDLALTGTSLYFVRADAGVPAIILQEQNPIELQVAGEGSEYAKINLAAMFGCYAVRNGGYGRYQSAVKATLS